VIKSKTTKKYLNTFLFVFNLFSFSFTFLLLIPLHKVRFYIITYQKWWKVTNYSMKMSVLMQKTGCFS